MLHSHKVEQLSECFSAVAVEIFLLPRELGESLAQRREKENRVVAKSLVPARSFQQFACYKIGNDRP